MKIIEILIRFGNNDGCQYFKMQWPITYINTHISDINKFIETYNIFNDLLEVSLRQFVWSRSQGIIAFLNHADELLF